MVQSAYDVKQHPKDFKNMTKNCYPIVICYNGRDHFVPTIQTSEKDFLNWKMHRKFGSLLAAILLISKECNRQGVFAANASSIRAVIQCLETHLPKISKTAHTYYLQLRAKSRQTHCRPGVNPPAGTIPTSASSVDPLHPSAPSSRPSTSGHSDPTHPAAVEEQEETNIKGYKCQHCGVVKGRKPGLRWHLWTLHKLGTPIVCNLGNCNNKSFSPSNSILETSTKVNTSFTATGVILKLTMSRHLSVTSSLITRLSQKTKKAKRS